MQRRTRISRMPQKFLPTAATKITHHPKTQTKIPAPCCSRQLSYPGTSLEILIQPVGPLPLLELHRPAHICSKSTFQILPVEPKISNLRSSYLRFRATHEMGRRQQVGIQRVLLPSAKTAGTVQPTTTDRIGNSRLRQNLTGVWGMEALMNERRRMMASSCNARANSTICATFLFPYSPLDTRERRGVEQGQIAA